MTPILTGVPDEAAPPDELELPELAEVAELPELVLALLDVLDELHAVTTSNAAHTTAPGARYLL
jgi:hypothetical protein